MHELMIFKGKSSVVSGWTPAFHVDPKASKPILFVGERDSLIFARDSGRSESLT
jgi:hypothetical protein